MIDRKALQAVIDAPTHDLVELVRDHAKRPIESFFQYRDWRGADFGTSDIENIRFAGSNISKVDFSKTQNTRLGDFRFAQFPEGRPVFGNEETTTHILTQAAQAEIKAIVDWVKKDQDAKKSDPFGKSVVSALDNFFGFMDLRLPLLTDAHQDSAAARKAASLALTSLSLSKWQTLRVFEDFIGLSQFQIDELGKVFEEELEKFSKLSETEIGGVARLCFSKSFGQLEHFDAIKTSFQTCTKLFDFLDKISQDAQNSKFVALGAKAFSSEPEFCPTMKRSALREFLRLSGTKNGKIWKTLHNEAENALLQFNQNQSEVWFNFLTKEYYQSLPQERKFETIQRHLKNLNTKLTRPIGFECCRLLMHALEKHPDGKSIMPQLLTQFMDLFEDLEDPKMDSAMWLVRSTLEAEGRFDEFIEFCDQLLERAAFAMPGSQEESVQVESVEARAIRIHVLSLKAHSLCALDMPEAALEMLESIDPFADLGTIDPKDKDTLVAAWGYAHFQIAMKAKHFKLAEEIYRCEIASIDDASIKAKAHRRNMEQDAVELFLLAGKPEEATKVANAAIARGPRPYIRDIILPFLKWLADDANDISGLYEARQVSPVSNDSWSFVEIVEIVKALSPERIDNAKALARFVEGRLDANELPRHLQDQIGYSDGKKTEIDDIVLKSEATNVFD